MENKKGKSYVRNFLYLLYLKVFRTNDTPQRLAAGLGIGVFSGIIPGPGPIAALFLASLLKANRTSALIGSLLTNTWVSIATFIAAAKLGAIVLGLDWYDVRQDWLKFLENFRFINLFELSLIKVILPIIVGYLLLAFCCSLLLYVISLVTLNLVKQFQSEARPP